MVGWHHRLTGHELGQTPGDGKGQRSLESAVHGVCKSLTQFADRTTATTSQHPQCPLSLKS